MSGSAGILVDSIDLLRPWPHLPRGAHARPRWRGDGLHNEFRRYAVCLRSETMVGRGGLEPPASELDTAGRCANESGAASESRRVMCCARSQTLKGWWWPQTYPTRILQVQRAHLGLRGDMQALAASDY